MMTLVIIIHVIICALLIGIILVQAGRGGGLVDSLSGVESMFGTKTNALMTKTTTTLSILFFLTCVSLALLSVKQSRSLMRNAPNKPLNQTQAAVTQTKEANPAATVPAAQTSENLPNAQTQQTAPEAPKAE